MKNLKLLFFALVSVTCTATFVLNSGSDPSSFKADLTAIPSSSTLTWEVVIETETWITFTSNSALSNDSSSVVLKINNQTVSPISVNINTSLNKVTFEFERFTLRNLIINDNASFVISWLRNPWWTVVWSTNEKTLPESINKLYDFVFEVQPWQNFMSVPYDIDPLTNPSNSVAWDVLVSTLSSYWWISSIDKFEPLHWYLLNSWEENIKYLRLNRSRTQSLVYERSFDTPWWYLIWVASNNVENSIINNTDDDILSWLWYERIIDFSVPGHGSLNWVQDTFNAVFRAVMWWEDSIMEKTPDQIKRDWEWIEFNIWEAYMAYISDVSRKYFWNKINSGLENINIKEKFLDLKIFASSDASFLVKENGEMFVMWDNTSWRLWPVDRSTLLMPTSSLNWIKDIVFWNGGILYLRKDGSVFPYWLNTNWELWVWNTNTVLNSNSIIIWATAVSIGLDHSLILKSGEVLSAWNNNYWQLWNWTNDSKYTHTKIENLSWIIAIKAGEGYSLFLKDDWSVYWAWDNSSWQLWIWNISFSTVPVLITDEVKAIDISPSNSSIFLKENGDLFVTWESTYWELWNWSIWTINTPVNILSEVLDFDFWTSFSVFLKENWDVYATGLNAEWQLWDWTNDNKLVPTKMLNISAVKNISAWASHLLLLDSLWDVYAVGKNNSWQLWNWTGANINTPEKVMQWVISIDAKSNNSIFLKESWDVFMAGANEVWQLWDWTRRSLQSFPIFIMNIWDYISDYWFSNYYQIMKDKLFVVFWDQRVKESISNEEFVNLLNAVFLSNISVSWAWSAELTSANYYSYLMEAVWVENLSYQDFTPYASNANANALYNLSIIWDTITNYDYKVSRGLAYKSIVLWLIAWNSPDTYKRESDKVSKFSSRSYEEIRQLFNIYVDTLSQNQVNKVTITTTWSDIAYLRKNISGATLWKVTYKTAWGELKYNNIKVSITVAWAWNWVLEFLENVHLYDEGAQISYPLETNWSALDTNLDFYNTTSVISINPWATKVFSIKADVKDNDNLIWKVFTIKLADVWTTNLLHCNYNCFKNNNLYVVDTRHWSLDVSTIAWKVSTVAYWSNALNDTQVAMWSTWNLALDFTIWSDDVSDLYLKGLEIRDPEYDNPNKWFSRTTISKVELWEKVWSNMILHESTPIVYWWLKIFDNLQGIVIPKNTTKSFQIKLSIIGDDVSIYNHTLKLKIEPQWVKLHDSYWEIPWNTTDIQSNRLIRVSYWSINTFSSDNNNDEINWKDINILAWTETWFIAAFKHWSIWEDVTISSLNLHTYVNWIKTDMSSNIESFSIYWNDKTLIQTQVVSWDTINYTSLNIKSIKAENKNIYVLAKLKQIRNATSAKETSTWFTLWLDIVAATWDLSNEVMIGRDQATPISSSNPISTSGTTASYIVATRVKNIDFDSWYATRLTGWIVDIAHVLVEPDTSANETLWGSPALPVLNHLSLEVSVWWLITENWAQITWAIISEINSSKSATVPVTWCVDNTQQGRATWCLILFDFDTLKTLESDIELIGSKTYVISIIWTIDNSDPTQYVEIEMDNFDQEYSNFSYRWCSNYNCTDKVDNGQLIDRMLFKNKSWLTKYKINVNFN